jgi:hypothetical protein
MELRELTARDSTHRRIGKDGRMTGSDMRDYAASDPPLKEAAAYLQETLGDRITAYLAGLPDTSALAASVRDEADANVAGRLGEAYRAVRAIADTYDARTAQSWLFGTNSFLDDAAPIEVLRAADRAEVLNSVRAAAHAFAHPS